MNTNTPTLTPTPVVFVESPLPLMISHSPPIPSTIADVDTFKTLLVRTATPLVVETRCRELISQYTNSHDWVSLYHLYKVIRETRETLLERDLTYIQLYAWNEIHPVWAAHALTECVYTYGCWKDIKHLCEYCKTKSTRQDHPFILYAICVLEQRLKDDWRRYQSKGNYLPHNRISYAAKWTPRENSKYGWIYTILCASYFGYLQSAVTPAQKEKALTKSKMELRKILATLNRRLDTVEIKQCGNHWNYIVPQSVPINAAFKYHRAFYRHGVDIRPKESTNTHVYPYHNVKRLADRVNAVYEVDKEWDNLSTINVQNQTPTPNPLVKTSEQYRQNFDELVATFFHTSSTISTNSTTTKPRTLAIIDMATMSPHDVDNAIGWCCVECDGAMVLNTTGKYQFMSFQTTSVCNRIQELSTMIAKNNPTSTPTPPTPTHTSTPTSTISHLKAVCLFMEKCFKETQLTDPEREAIKMFIFSRHPSAELTVNESLFEIKPL